MAYPPSPQIPQRGARSTFSGAVDAFLRWLSGLPAYLDAFMARLETIAAGGAYSIPYVFRTSSFLGGPNSAFAVFDVANQSATKVLYLDKLSFDQGALPIFQQWLKSTSAVKGTITIRKTNNPAVSLTFNVTDADLVSYGYASFGGAVVASSSANPFTVGDSVIAQFTPNGDKGDVGNADKKVQTAPAPVNGVVTVDYRNGNCLVWSPAAASTSALTITNWPASGTLGEFWIIGGNMGAATVAMSNAIGWLRPDGTYNSTASINTNHGATLRPTGEDNILLWGVTGLPNKGKVAR